MSTPVYAPNYNEPTPQKTNTLYDYVIYFTAASSTPILPHGLLRSVFIHPDGNVGIEEYDGLWRRSWEEISTKETHSAVADAKEHVARYKTMRNYILHMLCHWMPIIMNEGFLNPDTKEKFQYHPSSDYCEVTFYTAPVGYFDVHALWNTQPAGAHAFERPFYCDIDD